MANKSASRALLNLFSPGQSVPAPAAAMRHKTESPANPVLSKHKPVLPPINTSDSCLHNDTKVPTFLLEDSRHRTWEIAYYHKSGSIMDVCKVDIIFNWNGRLVGRGSDNIGAFSLIGKPHLDIIGWSWIIHKTYARDLSPASNEAEWISSVADDMYLIDGESDVSALTSRAHVGHMAYWTDGYSELDDKYTKKERCPYWVEGSPQSQSVCSFCSTLSAVLRDKDRLTSDCGFFGVWETISNDSHFELQKGGVFRASISISAQHVSGRGAY